jgi:Rod binding domain-containing protein
VTAASASAMAPVANRLTVDRAPPQAAAPPDAELVRASRQFEEVFVRQILESTNLAQAGGKGYGDMVVDAFAQAITSGEGLGFGDQIARMLAEAHHRAPAAVNAFEAGTQVATPKDVP